MIMETSPKSNMFTRSYKENHGFTLLELMLTITIFSIGSFGIAYMLIDAQNTTSRATSRTTALLYTREGLEAVRSIRDSATSTITVLDACANPCGVSSLGGTWAFSGTSNTSDDGVFTRTIMVSTINVYTRQITASTVWTGPNGRSESVSLSTWLSSWR